MSKKTAGLAKTNIKKNIVYFEEHAPYIISYSLVKIGISESIEKELKKYGILKLSDLIVWLDRDGFVYDLEKNNKMMTKLSRCIGTYRKKIDKKSRQKKTKELRTETKGLNPKIKPIHINAIKKITNNLVPLVDAGKHAFLNKTLKELGASPYCYNYAYKKNIHTLQDVYNSLDNLIQIYNYVQGHLKNLADNIAKVCSRELKSIKDKGINSKLPFKIYTYNQFLKLADWKKKSSVVKENDELLVKTKTGFQFYVGSINEKTIFNRLNKLKDVIDIRGQDLIIPYKGKGGVKSEYHPDFVVYYNNGSICLYEVKPVIQMAKHEVLVKYVAMKKYAEKHGFLYVMGGVSSSSAQIKTFDDIKNRKVDPYFKSYVKRILKANGFFERNDLLAYKHSHGLVGNGETNTLFYDLASIVINDLENFYMYNKEGKSIHSWRIIKPKFKNRIHL